MFVDFLDKIQDSTVCIFHIFTVSCHIPIPTECVYHFTRFSVLIAIFQVIQCLCLIFHVFRFSRHNLGPTVCISNFSRFSLFLAIFQVLQCVFLILHVFPCFSPYSRSYHDFLIFLVCQFSRHIQGPTVCVSHFPRFSFFSPYYRS